MTQTGRELSRSFAAGAELESDQIWTRSAEGRATRRMPLNVRAVDAAHTAQTCIWLINRWATEGGGPSEPWRDFKGSPVQGQVCALDCALVETRSEKCQVYLEGTWPLMLRMFMILLHISCHDTAAHWFLMSLSSREIQKYLQAQLWDS